MLDEYLKNEEVIKFIKDLEKNPKCLQKSAHEETLYGKNIKDELALYLFYDTLLKYKIIIDDKENFEDFLNQIIKLFRKIESYDDIILGINKVLINFVMSKLDIRDFDSKENKNKIVEYFYNKYILEGYFVHGYSSTYEEFVKGRNFIPEQYPNHYQKIIKIKQIFEKHKLDVMDKNFNDTSVCFTDDFIMGCHYSVVAPGYLYQLLVDRCKDNSAYLKQNKSVLISSLKRFMSNNLFSKSEEKSIIKMVEEEWDFIHRVPRKICLLFVKRNKVMELSKDKLNEYLESVKDLYELIERILTPRYNDVRVEKIIKYGEYQLVNLDDFYKVVVEEKKEEKVEKKSPMNFSFLNSYGVASALLIAGSFFITLGVIFSIIMILRGM